MKTVQRTLRYWVSKMPEQWRQLVYNNIQAQEEPCKALRTKHGDIVNALYGAFYWSDTPEGVKFWSDKANELRGLTKQ